MKKKAIIFDLDGTIANVEHRRHFIEKHPKDWRSFKESCIVDEPNQWALLINKMIRNYDPTITIIIVSGREEDFRGASLDWLEKHAFSFNELFMRADNDNRSDDLVKEDLYKAHIEPFYEILFVIDDRNRVVKKWRDLGLVCLQCADGNF